MLRDTILSSGRKNKEGKRFMILISSKPSKKYLSPEDKRILEQIEEGLRTKTIKEFPLLPNISRYEPC